MKALIGGCAVVLCFLISAPGQELKTRPRAAQPVPQTPRAHANNDAAYRKLRSIALGSEAVPVSNFVLKREAATFTFHSGAFYLLEPVNGKTTGAVFIGDAGFTLVPPTAVERRYLATFTKGQPFEERFSTAVFRFTDGSEAEIKKAAAPGQAPASGDAASMLQEVQKQLRTQLKQNLAARLLQDVLSSRAGGKFIAFIKGKNYSGKMIYDVDPVGVVAYAPDPPPRMRGGPRMQEPFSLAPEEVALMVWDENHYGIWTAFHLSREYAEGVALSSQQNGLFHIEHQNLDTAIAKNGKLDCTAVTTVVAQQEGVRVLNLNLFPALRVDWVADQEGQPVSFIQEEVEQDADFALLLPRELHKGESYSFTTKYGGKDAVSNESNGNYFPIARENWYPTLRFGQYATYDMTLHVPSGMTMAATGKLLRTIDEGKETVTEWTSEAPLAVAGFNFGIFKSQKAQDLSGHYQIETDVNAESPGVVESLRDSGIGALGTLSTVPMMKKATAEAQLALDLYTQYFGEEPYSRLSMTQQTVFNFGQSWPGLVFLPISYFLDSTQRHGLSPGSDHGFFKTVGPHEIAHQWWGHMVGFNSYRDQWMSEGFAEMSASLFLQTVYKDHGLDDFHEFWAFERKLLTDSNAEGRRAIDVGPLTLGYRLATARTGFNVPRALIYPKGAYILHMLRFMMQDSTASDPDLRFKALMHDFTKTFASQAATTEDFKAMVEKHMTRQMDPLGNHRMDWFFNQYVYGTDYPAYRFEHSFSTDENGKIMLNIKLTTSHVSDDFVMVVPVYVQMSKGSVARITRIAVTGNKTVEQHFRLGNITQRPEKVMIDYLDDLMGKVEYK